MQSDLFNRRLCLARKDHGIELVYMFMKADSEFFFRTKQLKFKC